MVDDPYGRHDDDGEAPGRDHLFLWTVFILLLIGLAFASWLGSFYIFGHPEKPRPYGILKKLGKIEAPRRFEVTAAPQGEFLSAKKLFDRYSTKNRLELEQENDDLLRSYIKNYHETKRLIPYITGRFEIIESYELQKTDIFPSGVVAFASSNDFPQVLLEHVFTAAPENVVGLRANLPRGLDMKLEASRDLAAIVHIERTTDGYLQFTALPLLYGSWGVKGSVGVFSLEPPPGLNLTAGMPIIHGQVRQDWLKTFVETRRDRRPVALAADKATPPSEPELVRLDSVEPGAAVPATGSLPAVPVATPVPIAARGTPPRHPASTPMLVASIATPRPAPVSLPPVAPPPIAPPPVAMLPVATPIPVATPLPLNGSENRPPLKPFIRSENGPDFAAPGASWRVYSPGRQPAGRAVTPSEASALAERGELGQHLYLRGSFVVTAAGESRAVLRAQGTGSEAGRPGSGSARVIVEFPPSIAPPSEGSTFARDETRGFEIRDVRKGDDGQINIYVREVTQPE